MRMPNASWSGSGRSSALIETVGTGSFEMGRLYRRRAMLLWPGLDRVRLSRTHGDPVRIANLVARRSGQPHDVIVSMVTGDPLPAMYRIDPDETGAGSARGETLRETSAGRRLARPLGLVVKAEERLLDEADAEVTERLRLPGRTAPIDQG